MKQQQRGNYFAAFPVADGARVFSAVKPGAPEGLRWFHPEDLHVTLAFFGANPEPDSEDDGVERIEAVREVLRQVEFPEDGMAIMLGELLLLPHRRRFSAISFAIANGGKELENLIGQWRGPLLEAAGCEPDTRPPLPHLTFARPDRKDEAFRPRKVIRWAAERKPPQVTITVQTPVLYGWSDRRPVRQFRKM